MKDKTWICPVCLALAVLAGIGQAANIEYVGVHEGIAGAFRTTTVDKSLDGDGDNVYGTDGYLFLNMISPGSGGSQVDYTDNMMESVPDYFSSETVIPGENVTSSNFQGFPDIDDPNQPPGPDVPDISPGYGGYSPGGGGGNAPEQTIFSYVIGPKVTAFRVGIYTDFAQSGEIRVVPNILGIKIGETQVVVDPYTTSHNCDGDMYFFDVTGARAGDVLEIRAGNTVVAHSRNFAVICGLTFDTIPSEKASNVNPADGNTDVLRDADLVWTPGQFAAAHDVYFGDNFDDVSDATTASVVYQGRQAESTLAPDRLEFGTTYYWRIDEVNAPPDSTIFKGNVWGFTTELFAYPVPSERITVTASSSGPGQGPENTVNGSGLVDDLHSEDFADVWITAMGDPGPASIQYEFDKALKIDEMLVWNYNDLMESILGLVKK